MKIISRSAAVGVLKKSYDEYEKLKVALKFV